MTKETMGDVVLKPCPFCGGKANWVEEHDRIGEPYGLVVQHKAECYFASLMQIDEAAMVDAWNSRPAPSEASGLAGELEELLEKATPGDLKTAEASVVDAGEYAECPLCNGEGEVEQDAHYNNFDAVALGVQFYGIGPHFGAHEKLWTWLMKNREAILTALTADKGRDEALGDDFPAMIACVLAESRMRRMLPQLADHISGDAILPDANDVEDAEQVARAIRSLKGAAK